MCHAFCHGTSLKDKFRACMVGYKIKDYTVMNEGCITLPKKIMTSFKTVRFSGIFLRIFLETKRIFANCLCQKCTRCLQSDTPLGYEFVAVTDDCP